jgi:hypothetical protein
MRVVFTYLPIRLKDVTEIYLKYSIKNLNQQGIVPIIFSDDNYFTGTGLKYELHKLDIDKKYNQNSLWSYPKLKVLSSISFPFVHLDNDLIVKDFSKLKSLIKGEELNLAYKHPLTQDQEETFIEIYKKYSNVNIPFGELNNTCIIGSKDYKNINKAYSEVLDVIENNYDFFCQYHNNVPPITLNQQYVNLYFKKINYLFLTNPDYSDLDTNGVCHMADKNMAGKFVKDKTLI